MAKYSPRFFPPLPAPRTFRTRAPQRASLTGRQTRGDVWARERYGFALQKVWFWRAKGMVLQRKRYALAQPAPQLRPQRGTSRQASFSEKKTVHTAKPYKTTRYKLQPNNIARTMATALLPKFIHSNTDTRLRETTPYPPKYKKVENRHKKQNKKFSQTRKKH